MADYTSVYITRQHDVALEKFGRSNAIVPYATHRAYPNMPGYAARQVAQYWIKEIDRVASNIYTESALSPIYRQRTKWVGIYKSLPASDTLLSNSQLGPFWESAGNTAILLNASKDLPSPFRIAWESVKEAAKEAATAATIGGGGIVKWLLYGLGLLIVLNVVQTVKRK